MRAEIPGVGLVDLPASMSDDDKNAVGKRLYDEAQLAAATAVRRDAYVRFTIWLIPPLVLYALGWAVAWVNRGFANGSPR